jgi:uridine kinase
MKSVLIGIAGGTASGKTTVTRKIKAQFPDEIVNVIRHDDYYKDQSELLMEERILTNYDHPNSLDNELLLIHLKALINHEAIEKPTYDFSNHTRSHQTETILPTKIIMLEGILVLEDPRLRELMDIKIYVDTDDDIRFIRRLIRDMQERNRSVDAVVNQYLNTVKPMHNQFVIPSKRYADLIIPEGGSNNVAIDLIASKIKQLNYSKNI